MYGEQGPYATIETTKERACRHMFKTVKISPSLLSADFMNMEHDVKIIEEGGAGFAHVDVMDGHFVPNLTMGVPFVKCLKSITKLPLDVHLMISNPLEQLPWFLAAGADWLTVHIEALEGKGEVEQAISLIREAGAHPGLTLKPATPMEVLEPYISQVDMILVMSVNPGFSGQSYIEGTEARIEELVAMAKAQGASPFIEVDGGIGVDTAAGVAAAGADVLVAGNAVFGASDPKAAIQEIMRIAAEAQGTQTPTMRKE